MVGLMEGLLWLSFFYLLVCIIGGKVMNKTKKPLMRPPLVWYGGKQKMVKRLIVLIPIHKTYIEPFGGAASLLFAKPKSRIEVYNDLNSNLVNFFRVLQVEKTAKQLYKMLRFTPYSKEEFSKAVSQYEILEDPVEKSHAFFIASQQCFSGRLTSEYWGYSKEANRASAFRSKVERLLETGERFRWVQIENSSWESVLNKYDSKKSFFYIDPPYLQETRKMKDSYGDFELDNNSHSNLISTLSNNIEGKSLLSGYDNPVYQRLSWRRIDFKSTCHAAGRTRNSGLQGEGKVKNKQQRIESVWLNYERR